MDIPNYHCRPDSHRGAVGSAATGSVPTAAELLERAHDMLSRAHIMLDGWQQAADWHHDYEKFKAQNSNYADPPLT